MTIEQDLLKRAASTCELCSSPHELRIFDVAPNAGPNKDTSILICEKCKSLLHSSSTPLESDWYGIKESMWSEHPAVQVVSYRVLRRMGANPWAQDLLQQMYLDEKTLAWAESGLAEEAPSPSMRVVDSNGTPLQEGDTVTLIKDLDVKGANFTAKRGTTVKNISLTDDSKYIEGRVNGVRIVLVAAYLKKA